jgi:hypothetical protein
MKNFTFKICCLFALTLGIVFDGFSQTTIFSSGFETSDPAFSYNATTNTCAVSTSNFRTGARCGYATGTGNPTYSGSAITPLQTFYPGVTYTVSVYARVGTCTGKLQIMKSATATNAAMLAASGGDIILSSASSNVTSTTYAQLSGTFTVSATESKYIGFQMQLATNGCNGAALYIDDATISVTCSAPSISPSSASLCSGGTASFTVSPTSALSSMQWQSSPDDAVWTNIAGATAASYTTAALASNKYYRVVYTDPCGSSTNTSSVLASVASAATFASQPTSTTVCQGSSSTLTVAANAGATYQWQYYNGSTWANVANGTPTNITYSGSTSGTLTVTAAAGAAAGTLSYRCNATACSGTTSSSTATVTVNAKPTAGTLSPTSTSGGCGSNPSFTLTLGGGYTGTVQWQSSTDGTNWYDLLAETASTYSATATSTTYYRTTQTANGCTANQSATASVTITGVSTATYTGANGGAWTTASNWSTNAVPTACTNVIIPSGASVACAAGTSATTVCHDLTVASGATLTINFGTNTNGLYLFVKGNFTNNGTVTQSQASTAQSSGAATGQCSKCGGLEMDGQNVTWGGTGTYPLLTVTVGDNSSTTMIDDASIDFLNCTKTTVVGKLSLGAETLTISNIFAQSGSEVHVNTGTLWLALQSSMLIDIVTLYPEYGTVIWDLTGGWGISGGWSTIGGTGFYNLIERSNGSTSLIRNSCNQKCRKDFTIWSGTGHVEWDPSTAYQLEVLGDFINEDNDGTVFDANQSTVLMDGPGLVYSSTTNTYVNSTAIQNITGPAITTFHKLTINNATTGVKLNAIDAKADATGILTCTAGPFYLNSQRFTMMNPATTAIVRTSGYVVSETNSSVNPSILEWDMGATNGAHIFPFGVSGSYIPFTFNKASGTSNISVSTRATSASDNAPWAGTSNVASVGNMTSYVSTYYADASLPSVIDRWWDIQSSAAATAALTFSYRGSENTTSAAPTGLFQAQHWNGSSWDVPVGSGTGITGGSVGTVTVSTASTFSPWVLSSSSVVLPVSLAKFETNCDNSKVAVEWETSSEFNNKYFTVEKSLDGHNNYIEVGTVDGAGNSSVTQKYNFVDQHPFEGISYYRLKRTDYAGNSSYFMATSTSCKDNLHTVNAFNNQIGQLVVNINTEAHTNYTATVYDALGNKVFTKQLTAESGSNNYSFDISTLSSGVYIVSLHDGIKNTTRKIVVNN